MTFEFATANKIIFGPGTLSRAAPLVQHLGKALVVLGRTIERAAPLLEQLEMLNIECTKVHVAGEPTTARIDAAVNEARAGDIDVVVGFGGGSVIDASKAIAALLTNAGPVLDYLEVIGAGKKIICAPLPHIAIPTTAGTGAEVTKNAVLLSEEHKVKVSLRHDLLLPSVAIVDPELTLSLPPSVTANSGLDALTQLIEPFVSIRANPLTDGLCREGMVRARSLREAFENGDNRRAREDMALASLFGGLALANAGLGAVHGFAGPIGGLLSAPHGAVCARLLPFVMETNVRALQEREPASAILARYIETSRILTHDPNATIADGLQWVHSLCEDLAVKPLSAYGMSRDDIPLIVGQARNASSMKGNPIQLGDEELLNILKRAL
ncbi:iron-containing alcohol dehydrogenase [candidate division KSB1 bacterium]|nr:iron-containing alcohol dehydrogenase [candidate division KSB1 bacterium]